METEADRLSTDSAMESTRVAGKTATAIKSAAQQFFDDRGIRLNIAETEDFIRDKPIVSAGIAAAAGFIVGGGLISRPGVALLFLFGRRLAGELTTNLLFGAMRRNGRA
jgi:ElaB/YqjD/DUF883 family membrane-anchored ribosome-binding protein